MAARSARLRWRRGVLGAASYGRGPGTSYALIAPHFFQLSRKSQVWGAQTGNGSWSGGMSHLPSAQSVNETPLENGSRCQLLAANDALSSRWRRQLFSTYAS